MGRSRGPRAIPIDLESLQLIQKDLHRIEVKLVVPRPLSAEEEAGLGAYLTEKFRYPFDFAFANDDALTRAANGKFEEFRSEVP